MSFGIKCAVKDCPNEDVQGKGIWLNCINLIDEMQTNSYWICMSCWEFITEAKDMNSQIFRNAYILQDKFDNMDADLYE
jgi:hypothetical protein